MNKTILVVRTSTDKQDTDMQVSECLAYAKEHDMNIIKTFDYHESVYKNKYRDNKILQEVVSMAEDGFITDVLFWKTDRISRQLDAIQWFTDLADASVNVHSITEGGQLPIEDVNDRMALIFKLFVAESEGSNGSLRVKTKMREIQDNEDDFVFGGIPMFMYLEDTGIIRNKAKGTTRKRLNITENNRKLVKDIFHKYLYEDYSTVSLAEWLNSKGIKPIRSDSFDSNRVYNILTNPAYTGKLRYNTKKFKSSKSKQVVRIPKEEWKYKYIERIKVIEDYEFAEVQEKLKANNTKLNPTITYKNSDNAMLEGLIRCSYCGDRLYISGTSKTLKNGDKRMYYSYFCKNYKKVEHDKKAYSTKIIDEAVESELIKIIANIKNENIESLVSDEISNIIEDVTKSIEQLESDLQKENKILIGLKEELTLCMIGESEFTKGTIASMMKNSEDKIVNKEKELLKLKMKEKSLKHEIENKLKQRDRLKDFENLYKSVTDFNTKKNLIRSVIDKIVLSKDDIKILLNIHR